MNTFFIAHLGIIIYLVCYLCTAKTLSARSLSDDSKTPPAHTKFDVWTLSQRIRLCFSDSLCLYCRRCANTRPALAMAWGWWAGLLWIWFGNILIGAVTRLLVDHGFSEIRGKPSSG